MKNIPNKAITNRDRDESDKEFHFAATGIHNPVTIRAKDAGEAQMIFNRIVQSESPPVGAYEADEKVDDKLSDKN